MTTQETVTLESVEARLNELRSGVLNEGVTAEGFNDAVTEYAGLLVSQRTFVVQANEVAITQARMQLGMGIATLVESLGLAELKQEPVTRIVWQTFAAEGTEGDDGYKPARTEVSVNVAAKALTSRKPRAASNGDGSKSEGRDLVAIYEANANDDEREAMAKLEARHELPEDAEGSLADGKKFNSATWALKNRVANRVEKETAA